MRLQGVDAGLRRHDVGPWLLYFFRLFQFYAGVEVGVDGAGRGAVYAIDGFEVAKAGIFDAAGGPEMIQQRFFAGGADAGDFVQLTRR